MAINPVSLKATLNALRLSRKKETRDAMIIAILVPVLVVLLITAFAFYIITSPLSLLASFIFGNELDLINDFQVSHGFSQSLGIYETDYQLGYGTSYEGVVFTDGDTAVVYYSQLDSRWADLNYGSDKIGTNACGPTAMAMVVSTLTSETVDPVAMCQWSVDNGGFAAGQGSYHSLIPNAAAAWGLPVEGVSKDGNVQKIVDALSSGQLVVAIMGPGHFTSGGHFIVLRGVTSTGKILVADPSSRNRSNQEWDLSLIVSESRNGASAGGPFWIIGSPVVPEPTPDPSVDLDTTI